MPAVIGALRADLSASIAEFTSDMGKAGDVVGRFATKFERLGRQVSSAGLKLSVALTAPFIALAKVSSDAARESSKAMADVEAALASMGGRSGKTAAELQKSASALQDLSLFDDDDILKQVTANMLTFGNVQGKVFDRAQQVAVDLSERLGQDLKSSAIQVGKALNDPIKGLTALGRVGVQFTSQQKDMIKSLVASGRGIEAQGMILTELEKEFGGAAKAARAADPGGSFAQAWRDIQEILGGVVNQILPPLTKLLQGVRDALQSMSPQMQTFVVGVVAAAAALGPLLTVVGFAVESIGALLPVWNALVAAFAAAGASAGFGSAGLAVAALAGEIAGLATVWGPVIAAVWEFRDVIFQAVGVVFDTFKSALGEEIPKVLAALAQVFAQIKSGPIGEAFRWFGFVVATLVAGFTYAFGTAIVRILQGFLRVVTTVLKAVSGTFEIFGKLLTGDFVGAWRAATKNAAEFWGGLAHALDALFPGIEGVLKNVAKAVKQWIGDAISAVLTWIVDRFNDLPAGMRAAFDAAVGWARNFYQGVKTWLVDNLGPLVKWVGDRVADLTELLGKARQIRDAASHVPPPKVERAKPVAPPKAVGPAPAPEFSTGGGGGSKANKVGKAADKLREKLADLNDAVSHGLDERAMPKATSQAEALRRKIEDFADDAKQAGVDVSQFAGEIDKLKARINELEQTGLAEEARKFGMEVDKSARDVRAFASGGLAPLDDMLRQVDDSYESLRSQIVEAIRENEVLAETNDAAGQSMVRLKAQLSALDDAHAKATASAKAQYAAEKEIADLQAQAANARAQAQIDDLKQAAGKAAAPINSRMEEMQNLERQLNDERIAALTHLRELEAQKAQAEQQNDVDTVARLQTQIGLAQQYFDLVSSTTAVQIQTATRVKDAFQQFTDSLESNLTDMVMNWKGDLDGLRGIFKQLASELFIKPVVGSFSQGIGSFLQSFAGGFATGGIMQAGQWGVVGEHGPEPFFAGKATTFMPSHSLDALGGAKQTVVNQTIVTPDADSFRKSRRQVAGEMKRAVNFG